jgi:F-type H+-transporting ATPase subunit a
MKRSLKIGSLALAMTLGAGLLSAQGRVPGDSGSRTAGAAINQATAVEHAPAASANAAAAAEHGSGGGSADIIMPHITDSHHIELPCFNREWGCAVALPTWPPIHIGGLTVDLSPTKHVVMLLVAALLCVIVLISAARAHGRHHAKSGYARGFSGGMESVVLYVRNEVIIPNVGHHGEKYVPYLLTVFFFVLFANALGLFPYMATPTGNISVTATLAVISFVMIEIAGMRALGRGYIKTIVFWPDDMSVGMKMVLTLILTPVELLGKFTKPFALAIRLFANMTAGHVIVLAFIGIIFTFRSWILAPAPLFMAIGIMLLEVLVALIQAYIFTLLTATFIGQIREAHH